MAVVVAANCYYRQPVDREDGEQGRGKEEEVGRREGEKSW